MAYREIIVSHQIIRSWEFKFGESLKNIIRSLFLLGINGILIKIKWEYYVLWRAADYNGLELDVSLQNIKIWRPLYVPLSKLLKSYHTPRVIITDKLNSYKKHIKYMYKSSDHRSHKGLKFPFIY